MARRSRWALVAGLAAAGCRSAGPEVVAIRGGLEVPGSVLLGPIAFHGVTFYFETDRAPRLERGPEVDRLTCGPFLVDYRYHLFQFDHRRHNFPRGSEIYLFRREGDTKVARFRGVPFRLPVPARGVPFAVVEREEARKRPDGRADPRQVLRWGRDLEIAWHAGRFRVGGAPPFVPRRGEMVVVDRDGTARLGAPR